MRDGPAPSPYRSTPVFDEHTLPAALRREHRTKQGVWGVIRVLDGELKLTITETGKTQMLSPGAPGVVLPDQPHLVERRCQVKHEYSSSEFSDRLAAPVFVSDFGLATLPRKPENDLYLANLTALGGQ